MFIEIAHAAAEAAQEVATKAAHAAEPSILGSLGINLKLFLAQLINFAIVLFVLWKWAWKPILKVLDDRQKRVEQSVNDAKRIEEEMKLLDKKRTDAMRETEQKAQAIITEATAVAKTTRDELIEDARKGADHILVAGKEHLDVEKNRMVKEAKTELVDFIVSVSEKVIGESMNDKRHRALVEKTLEATKE